MSEQVYDETDLSGPYDQGKGRCRNGHPVNQRGRCEPLNTTGCPAPGEETNDADQP